MLCQLPMAAAVDEGLNVLHPRLHSSCAASRSASKSFQIKAQISIDRFHGIILLSGLWRVHSVTVTAATPKATQIVVNLVMQKS
jgi:hypothetical protein